MNEGFAYYNYRTDDYDTLTEAPADWSDYIPQYPPAQALYRLYQETGDLPIEAAKKVLRQCVGLPAQDGDA